MVEEEVVWKLFGWTPGEVEFFASIVEEVSVPVENCIHVLTCRYPKSIDSTEYSPQLLAVLFDWQLVRIVVFGLNSLLNSKTRSSQISLPFT